MHLHVPFFFLFSWVSFSHISFLLHIFRWDYKCRGWVGLHLQAGVLAVAEVNSGQAQTVCASSGGNGHLSFKLTTIEAINLHPAFNKGGPHAAEWFMWRLREVSKCKVLVWGIWQVLKERGDFEMMSHAFPSDSSLLSFQSIYTELIAGFFVFTGFFCSPSFAQAGLLAWIPSLNIVQECDMTEL